MIKKIALSTGILATLALPIATTVSCGSQPTTTYYFHNEINKFQSQMISQLDTEALNTNTNSLAKGQHVTSDKLGLDHIAIGADLKAIFVVSKVYADGQISVNLHIEQGSKRSRTKTITLFAKDSDKGVVLETTNAINEISIITNTEVAAVTEDATLDTDVLNTLAGATGKIFGSLPNTTGITLTYQVPAMTFAEDTGKQKSLAVTVTKNQAKSFAAIKIKLQTTADNEQEQQAINDVATAFGLITKINSTKEISAVSELSPLTLSMLSKYGEIEGTKPTDLKGTTLTHTISAISFGNEGSLVIHINKGIGTEKTVTIPVAVAAETA